MNDRRYDNDQHSQQGERRGQQDRTGDPARRSGPTSRDWNPGHYGGSQGPDWEERQVQQRSVNRSDGGRFEDDDSSRRQGSGAYGYEAAHSGRGYGRVEDNEYDSRPQAGMRGDDRRPQDPGGQGGSQSGYGGYGGGARRDDLHGSQQSGSQDRQRHRDPDYHHWREDQMRRLDEDYDAWRSERQKKFSDEFNEWRKSRQAAGESAEPGSSSSGSGSSSTSIGSGTGGAGSSGSSTT